MLSLALLRTVVTICRRWGCTKTVVGWFVNIAVCNNDFVKCISDRFCTTECIIIRLVHDL